MKKSGFILIMQVTFCGLIALPLASCGPRVYVSTGTTIGLKATPGDGNTRPPQVTLGYKRAEVALVPTSGSQATKEKCKQTSDENCGTDASSTLAAINFNTRWFTDTELRTVIGTGFAARELNNNDGFRTAFVKAALGPQALSELRSVSVNEIAAYVMEGGKTDPVKLENFFTCVGKNQATAKSLANKYAGKTKQDFENTFGHDYSAVAPGYRDKCVN